MHFAYDGFTHKGDKRSFHFRRVDKPGPAVPFCIDVALRLFSQNQVPVQDGPRFCLQLLETAFAAEPNDLDRFQTYSVVGEDFRPLLMEREKARAAKALKTPPRRPFRKPPPGSNLTLGLPSGQR